MAETSAAGSVAQGARTQAEERGRAPARDAKPARQSVKARRVVQISLKFIRLASKIIELTGWHKDH
jgi:hypothetical protein